MADDGEFEGSDVEYKDDETKEKERKERQREQKQERKMERKKNRAPKGPRAHPKVVERKQESLGSLYTSHCRRVWKDHNQRVALEDASEEKPAVRLIRFDFKPTVAFGAGTHNEMVAKQLSEFFYNESELREDAESTINDLDSKKVPPIVRTADAIVKRIKRVNYNIAKAIHKTLRTPFVNPRNEEKKKKDRLRLAKERLNTKRATMYRERIKQMRLGTAIEKRARALFNHDIIGGIDLDEETRVIQCCIPTFYSDDAILLLYLAHFVPGPVTLTYKKEPYRVDFLEVRDDSPRPLHLPANYRWIWDQDMPSQLMRDLEIRPDYGIERAQWKALLPGHRWPPSVLQHDPLSQPDAPGGDPRERKDAGPQRSASNANAHPSPSLSLSTGSSHGQSGLNARQPSSSGNGAGSRSHSSPAASQPTSSGKPAKEKKQEKKQELVDSKKKNQTDERGAPQDDSGDEKRTEPNSSPPLSMGSAPSSVNASANQAHSSNSVASTHQGSTISSRDNQPSLPRSSSIEATSPSPTPAVSDDDRDDDFDAASSVSSGPDDNAPTSPSSSSVDDESTSSQATQKLVLPSWSLLQKSSQPATLNSNLMWGYLGKPTTELFRSTSQNERLTLATGAPSKGGTVVSSMSSTGNGSSVDRHSSVPPIEEDTGKKKQKHGRKRSREVATSCTQSKQKRASTSSNSAASSKVTTSLPVSRRLRSSSSISASQSNTGTGPRC